MSQAAMYPRPPTLAELLPPPDEPMESARHLQQIMVLTQSLDYAWSHRNDFFLGADMPVYYSQAQTKKNDFRCPDVFVVLGTHRRPERRAWIVWEEDGRGPDLVIELLSESTEGVDRGEKKRIYASSLKVPEYFLFDPFSGVLEGYDLRYLDRGEAESDEVPQVYVPKVPDDQGRLSTRLGLRLGKVRGSYGAIEADWLRWIDRWGKPLPMPGDAASSEAERANAETARANAETARADAEAARAARLEAELLALKQQLAKK
jgi:Uma2 family endonuclease